MKKILTCLVMLTLLLTSMIPIFAYETGTYQTTGTLYVRSGPDGSTSAIGILPKGSTIQVNKVENEKWGQFKFEGKTAYVSLKYATKVSSTSTTTTTTKISSSSSIETLLGASQTGKKTSQIITVMPYKGRYYQLNFYNKKNGKWKRAFYTTKAYAGLNGLSADRTEGDKTTPIGSFALNLAFGSAKNPGTKMTYKRITKNSYWGGTKAGWGSYKNRWYQSKNGKPLAKGGEYLYQYRSCYKYAVNIAYNQSPAIDKKGCCIFLHCYTSRNTTSGCIAVSQSMMKKILKNLKNNKAYIIIVPSKADILKY